MFRCERVLPRGLVPTCGSDRQELEPPRFVNATCQAATPYLYSFITSVPKASSFKTSMIDDASHPSAAAISSEYASTSGFSGSQRRGQGSASFCDRLPYLPSLFPHGSPLPSPSIRPSSQQSSLTADTPNSIKRPLDTYEEREEGGKKAKTDTLSSPGGNSLHIFLDDTEREKLKVFRTALYPRPFRSSATTSTQSSSDDSSGSE